MAPLRVIRRRLRSIQNTKQIMRAMQLVSASKFKRSQDRLLEVRGLMEFLDGLLQRVLAAIPDLDHPTTRFGWWDHPLCIKREEAADALVIFTSDAGLCGAYNTNLIQLAEAELRRPFDSAPRPASRASRGGQDVIPSKVEGRRDTLHQAQCITIGKKGHRHFTKRGHEVVESHIDLAGRPNLRQAREIGQSLMKRFLLGEVSSIKLLYPQFVSSMTNRPVVETWLPVQLRTPQQAQPASDYLFEPSPKRVFEDLLPRWALAKFQLVMLEAFTSEHSARMIAMKNATDNAAELIDELTIQRNKSRQASITKEISEIVGTAEALK